MVGRKRRNVRRQPNGQPQRDRGLEPRLVANAMPHRQEVAANDRHDAKAESPMGRLLLNGWISQTQYDAGVAYREIVARYRVVIDAPSANERSMSGVIVGPWGGRGDPIAEDEVHRRRDKYNAAYEALECGAGHRAARSVAHCAVHERGEWELHHLKNGLTALAAHFGFTRR
jgi:hypothetical protein